MKSRSAEAPKSYKPCKDSPTHPDEKCEQGYRCVADTDTEGVGMFGPIPRNNKCKYKWSKGKCDRHLKINEKRCAEICTYTLDCQVYEFSPEYSQCKLVAADQQKAGKVEDWKYCVKGTGYK